MKEGRRRKDEREKRTARKEKGRNGQREMQ
jgi:hypothetical protein